MATIGLHLRLEHTLTNLVERALMLEVPFFQSFLVTEQGLIKPSDHDIAEFLHLRRQSFNNLYLHGSFWINLCSSRTYSLHILKKELSLAHKLEFTDLILHPGSAKESASKEAGIDILARSLNILLKKEKNISIALENTTHAAMTIGSDLEDFAILLNKLDYDISFCLDTAHAFAYGYDIVNELDAFITLVDNTMGLERVKLIHLNDTLDPIGSKCDRHAIPGTGQIGKDALKKFIEHPALLNVPVILELPVLSQHDEHQAFDTIKRW